MSYLRKGFRQTQTKNVIERGFIPKIDFLENHKNQTNWERGLDRRLEKMRISKKIHSNWIQHGRINTNDRNFNIDGTRNYRNCLHNDYRFIELQEIPSTKWIGWGNVPLLQVRDSKMFELYGSEDKIYHLTSPKNWNQIRVHGLLNSHKNHNYPSRRNQLYFLQSDEHKVFNYVGWGQCTGGTDNLPIVVLEIDKKGITGELFGEDGNEFVTPLHMVLTNQKRILPQYIKYHKTFHTSTKQYYDDREEFGQLKQDYLSFSTGIDKENISIMGVDFDSPPHDIINVSSSRDYKGFGNRNKPTTLKRTISKERVSTKEEYRLVS